MITVRFNHLELLPNSEKRADLPAVLSGKTGHDLPVLPLAPEADPDIFAAFTGPDGGITSISRTGEEDTEEEVGKAPNRTHGMVSWPCFQDEVDASSCVRTNGGRLPNSADCEDFDFIDLEEGGAKRQANEARSGVSFF